MFFLAAHLLLDFGLVPENAPLRAALVALTAALSIGFGIAVARHVNGREELERRIAVESLAIAYGGAVVLVSSYSLFVKAGGSPSAIRDVFYAMIMVWVIASIFVSRRYRR